jgi:hypothetical protein
MSRGKWESTKLKEAINKAVKEAAVLQIATEKSLQQIHSKKPLADSLREHIGKMIDRIDPLESFAVAGLTYIMHGLILNNEALLAAAGKWISNEPLSGIQSIWGYVSKTVNAPKEIAKPDSIEIWITSFVIAFCIIRWGDKMIAAGLGDITKIITMIGLV